MISGERSDQENPQPQRQEATGHPWHAESHLELALYVFCASPHLCRGQTYYWEVLQSLVGCTHSLHDGNGGTLSRAALKTAPAAGTRTDGGLGEQEICWCHPTLLPQLLMRTFSWFLHHLNKNYLQDLTNIINCISSFSWLSTMHTMSLNSMSLKFPLSIMSLKLICIICFPDDQTFQENE